MKNNKNLNENFKKAMNKTKGNKKLQILVVIVFVLIYLVSNYIDLDGILNEISNSNNINVEQVSGKMLVSFLDVGQGDATYIRVNDKDILIDAGPRESYENLLQELKEKNIDDFELVMATHPHEDHIGGMKDLFDDYKIESFYMPKLTYTTKTFENMINAVKNQNLKINIVKEGDIIDLGDGAYIEVFTPNKDSYQNVNNYSPIMKLVYGETSFMLTGDAESEMELEAVSKYGDKLKSDVLSFGHHGSSTSSSIDFIEAVSPEFGVISVGADNSYGHPHKEILKLIKDYNIETFRTDEQGEINFISDGKTIEIKTEK